jgi:hypothetical protein
MAVIRAITWVLMTIHAHGLWLIVSIGSNWISTGVEIRRHLGVMSRLVEVFIRSWLGV